MTWKKGKVKNCKWCKVLAVYGKDETHCKECLKITSHCEDCGQLCMVSKYFSGKVCWCTETCTKEHEKIGGYVCNVTQPHLMNVFMLERLAVI